MLRLLGVLLLGLVLFHCCCFRQGSPIGQPGIKVPMELKKSLVFQSSSFYLLRDFRHSLLYLAVWDKTQGFTQAGKHSPSYSSGPFLRFLIVLLSPSHVQYFCYFFFSLLS